MHTTRLDNLAILQELKRIVAVIPDDFGRGRSLANSFLISHLILEYNLKIYLEIGVQRGISFFPAAYATKLLGGMAYGIDPYDYKDAEEHDLDDDSRQDVHAFLTLEKISQIYDEVIKLRDELVLTDNTKIIREKSTVATDFLRDNKIAIDLLHIGGNHDATQASEDIDLYLPFVRSGGFVVLDDVDWDSVKPEVNRLNRKFDKVFNNGKLSIFSIETPKREIAQLQKSRFRILHSMIENLDEISTTENALIQERTDQPVISVIVISYNQEKYIADCLEGIFAQKGDFKVELVIGDDCSTDTTLKIIRKYVDSLQNHRFEVKILPTDKNIGMTKNFRRCLAACTGSYIAVCEGDDFWIDCNKLQKQINFLKFHPECALCFTDIYLYFQERGELTKFDLQQRLDADVISTRELVLDYYIGNLSCCVYDARFMKKIPDNLFELYIGDWMFNIFYSQFGDIGHIKETMSVYRKHNKGVWASGNPEKQNLLLWNFIEEYNKFLSYNFDREFTIVQKRIEKTYASEFYKHPIDLAIVDDTFPHPLSAFRIQEFSSYLQEFDDIRIYSSGGAVGLLGGKTLDELIADFKREFPEYSGRIRKLEEDTIINARLFYMDFLVNAYLNIERIEQSRTPFAFTLYPGGGFGLNMPESDRMLKKVTSSPCFKKVIVTQKVTYDYLINKQYCRPDQIEFIFGVVTPLKQIESEYPGKKHYGIDKNILDICFVAHKYTKKGIDKGYDVFIDVAVQLCRKYEDIQFHVIGGFDENEIDVSDLKGRITFYGKRDIKWFDVFYQDKDIILSPNIPGTVYPGSFDGFPTGSCIDAGLRKTAIFCTDELSLNTKFFSEGDEIVIIPHDPAKITSIIEGYYQNPEKLKVISEKGSLRIKQLYNYEAQIYPRISILKKEIEQAEHSKKDIRDKMKELAYKKPIHFDTAEKSIKQNVELNKIKDSKAFSRIRGLLAPPYSIRARVLRRAYNNFFVRFRNFLKNRKAMGDLALIRTSELFNKAWYLANNPDVAQLNMDPALHYLRHGGFEGRDPSPYFYSNGYLDSYPDVRAAGINPLLHYLKYGKKEKRSIFTRRQ